MNEFTVQGSANGTCGFSACTSSTYSTGPRTVFGVKGGCMLSREEIVARRLEADKQSLAVLFGWLDDEMLEDDDALDDGSERELVEAEANHRELTSTQLLLGEI